MSDAHDPNAETAGQRNRRRGLWLVLAVVLASVVTIGIAALLTNIFERKSEGLDPFFRVVEITDTTVDPAIWGLNFPVHYDRYSRTVDMTRTRFGGSEAMVRTPTSDDPRDTVAQSRLEEDPRLRRFWAGYAFAEDFREERGHAYMLEDQIFTRRQIVARQPGSCLHCHASVFVAYLEAGDGDLFAGFEALNRIPYQEAVRHVEHPVSCIDCHEPRTMRLRITRPAFMTGIQRAMAARGVDDFDVNRDASRHEMRTYVCAQCHVEYYFEGPEKRLTYPWFNGLRADEILAYYEEIDFADFTHAVSGARVLKAQHPEFEMYSQGIHAQSGVTCSDCHMPYLRIGAQKVSDHWVRSPLLMLNASCQTCHRWSEDDLQQRVHTIQDRTYQLRNIALDAVLQLADAIAREAAADPASARVAAARLQQRRAQFLTDFVEAENSMGFHADQESMRVLGLAINYARLGLGALHGENLPEPASPVPAPPQTVTPPVREQAGAGGH